MSIQRLEQTIIALELQLKDEELRGDIKKQLEAKLRGFQEELEEEQAINKL